MSTQDPYNRSGYYMFLGSMVASLLFFFYLSFLHPGVRGVDQNIVTDYTPGSASAKFDLAAVEEPWLSSDDMIAAGKKVYDVNCAVCHAADGTGVAAMGARNLVEGKWKRGGTSIHLFETITKGLERDPSVPGIMAPFGHLPANERWALVHFIRSITNNQVADDSAQLESFGKANM